MRCTRVRELLSHYYDGELPSDDRAVVAEPVSHCETCAAEVEGFRRLSALVRHAAPEDDPNGWCELVHRLGNDNAISLRRRFDRQQVVRLASLAIGTAILIAVVGLFGHRSGREGHDPQMAQMAADFAHYLEIFERSPAEADCAGKRCTMVAVGQQLAATWEGSGWHITAVGLRRS